MSNLVKSNKYKRRNSLISDNLRGLSFCFEGTVNFEIAKLGLSMAKGGIVGFQPVSKHKEYPPPPNTHTHTRTHTHTQPERCHLAGIVTRGNTVRNTCISD